MQILAKVASAETCAIEYRRGVLARVWYESVFVRKAANVARKNSLVLMSWAGQGRSSLNSLGSSVLRSRRPNPTKGWNSVPTSSSSAFIGHIEYSAKRGGGGSHEKERKGEHSC